MKATLVIATALLTGCIPAASLIDTQGLLTEMRTTQTAAQALKALCDAPYRDVVATLGDRAGDICGG
jgi:hypothetical protein